MGAAAEGFARGAVTYLIKRRAKRCGAGSKVEEKFRFLSHQRTKNSSDSITLVAGMEETSSN